jgi:rSAM/selenodomain-associated transferase 2
MRGTPRLGVVIPTLNEAQYLPDLLSDIAALAVEHHVVIADGGSTDGTVLIATEAGATVVPAPRGRGTQLNAGADASGAEWLCFLHADVRMPPGARRVLEEALARDVDAGVWSLQIADDHRWARLMEAGARVRHRVAGLPYGDQGLLLRRAVFEAVGGYPALPIMEDVAMIRAVRRHWTVERFGDALSVSPRRWLREGPYRTWLRNAVLLSAFLGGVSAHRLARWYRPERM